MSVTNFFLDSWFLREVCLLFFFSVQRRSTLCWVCESVGKKEKKKPFRLFETKRYPAPNTNYVIQQLFWAVKKELEKWCDYYFCRMDPSTNITGTRKIPWSDLISNCTNWHFIFAKKELKVRKKNLLLSWWKGWAWTVQKFAPFEQMNRWTLVFFSKVFEQTNNWTILFET